MKDEMIVKADDPKEAKDPIQEADDLTDSINNISQMTEHDKEKIRCLKEQIKEMDFIIRECDNENSTYNIQLSVYGGYNMNEKADIIMPLRVKGISEFSEVRKAAIEFAKHIREEAIQTLRVYVEKYEKIGAVLPE